MELDRHGLSKKGTKSVLAERLKSFGDHVNIASIRKEKLVALLPLFLLLLLIFLMMMMLLETMAIVIYAARKL